MTTVARRGAALLEVLAALAIVSVAGLTLVTLGSQAIHTVTRLAVRERELRAADELLRRADVALRAGRWPADLELTHAGVALRVTPDPSGVLHLTVLEPVSGQQLLSTRMRGRVR